MRKTLGPDKINFRKSFASLKFVPRFFREIYKVDPMLFYSNLVCRIFKAVTPVAMLWVGKLIIDEVVMQITSGGDFERLWVLVSIEFGLALLSELLNRGITFTDALLGDRYSISTSVKIIQKTSELKLNQLEDSEFYNKLERARRQTTGRVGLMSNILIQGEDVIVVISLLVGVVAFEPWLIFLLVVSILPTIINEIKFSGSSYSLTHSWTQERRELDYLRYAGASDVTAKEVKLFALSKYLAQRFTSLANKYFAESKTLAQKRAGWGAVFDMIGITAYYSAYIYIILKTVAGILSLGDLTFLSGAFNQLRWKLQGFFTRFTLITEDALYLQDYFEFLDLKDPAECSKEKLPLPEKIVNGFEFRGVGFKYPRSKDWVVRDISFTLMPGEKLAFVGENGAGKTTLIKLLLRFYEPTEGEILLEKIPISKFDLVNYQRYFGVIFQDFVKYELTLRENIAMGEIRELHNQQRIEKASRQSLADEVISALPKGYDQQLGKRFKKGIDLSGGQWQKIAIARAYMKDSEVMILDEPTSALDARAETEAFNRFVQLTMGKTAVIISHRFSTVRIADRIMVLKNGAVLEIGTHKELINNGKLYSELFNLQAAGYQ